MSAALEPRLTEEQLEAAHAGPDGAFLIEAGPGTGKTFTMVERFVWLVRECRVPCDRILTVTFTDKAAQELKERITARLRPLATTPELAAMESAWIGTFHAVCARLLVENAYQMGAARELKVLDDAGQRLLLDALRGRLRSGEAAGVDLDALTALGADDVSDLVRRGLDFVLKLKGRGLDPEAFRRRALELHAQRRAAGNGETPAQADEAEREAIEILFAVYAAYEGTLAAADLVDFDDLILRVIGALDRSPEFRAWCRDRFQYIVVDEFQDTNRIQLELIRRFAAEGFGNVSVVGDARQSIYGWRDAEVENIRFRFPGRRLPLTRNRRSYAEILECATSLIRKDPDFASEPDLVAERGHAGEAVTLIMALSPAEEARVVAREIRRLRDGGLPLPDIAVLSHSVRKLPPEFEQELRLHGIPYVTSGGSGFFDREEVKDVVALLRLAEDPLDDGALVRVLQGPVVRLDDAGMYEVARRRFGRRGMRLRDCWDESAADGHPGIGPLVASRGARVLAAVEEASLARDALTVADTLTRLLDRTGYLRHIEARSGREGPRALRNLRQVVAMAGRFERDAALAGIGDFVRHLDRVIGAEVPVSEMPERTDAVSLLTVHAAKGLEWKAVFLVNTRPAAVRDSETLFFDPDETGFVMKRWSGSKDGRHPRFALTAPSAPATQLARAERRRVMYVGMTRAADLLYVSASRSEASVDDVAQGEMLGESQDDYFAEVAAWALGRPGAARIISAEQLGLPALEPSPVVAAPDPGTLLDLARRARRLGAASAAPEPVPSGPVRLSFSQLQQFEICPLRYRYREVWRVPAAPDELLPAAARGSDSAAVGAAVHEALRAWHGSGGDLPGIFAELAGLYGLEESAVRAGVEMLGGYLRHPLAQAPTLGTEIEFNLLVGGARLRGIVDRICETPSGTALVDYKTNRRLDTALVAAYSTQLRLYRLAAERGLLPGGRRPRLLIFDVRQGREIPVEPASEEAAERVAAAAGAIEAGRFELGPEHAGRPCFACAYRRVCPGARPGTMEP